MRPYPYYDTAIPEGYELIPVDVNGRIDIQEGYLWLNEDGTISQSELRGPYRPSAAMVRLITPTDGPWIPVENATPDIFKTVLMTQGNPVSGLAVSETRVGYHNGSRYEIPDTSYNTHEFSPKFWAYLSKKVQPFREPQIETTADGEKHQVGFGADGSITVGCTTVDSATMEKIIERRAKKIKK